MGEPVGAAEYHENVLEGAEGENGRFCRLGDRSLQPGSSLVTQTDACLGETAVVQHDAKAVELSGDSRDVREVLGSRIELQDAPILLQPLQQASPRRFVPFAGESEHPQAFEPP